MASRSRSLAALGLVGVGVAVVAVVATSGDDAEGTIATADEAAAVVAEPLPEPDVDSASPAPTDGSADGSVADTGDADSDADADAEPQAAPDDDTPDLPDRGVHPELREIDGWLQSDVSSLEELRGQVVAVQFWTFACSNCKATLPHMQQLYADYKDQGLEIVGVHAPEFEFEADRDNIVDAIDDLGVTWPVVLDTDKRTFHSWQEGRRGFWPRIYLLDRDGNIRYDHIGEGRYDEIDAAVQALLDEPA